MGFLLFIVVVVLIVAGWICTTSSKTTASETYELLNKNFPKGKPILIRRKEENFLKRNTKRLMAVMKLKEKKQTRMIVTCPSCQSELKVYEENGKVTCPVCQQHIQFL